MNARNNSAAEHYAIADLLADEIVRAEKAEAKAEDAALALATERAAHQATRAELAIARANLEAAQARAERAPDLAPVLAKVEAAVTGTGDRIEAALAAQTQQLLAGTPAPDEIEFYVRRDGGEISSIVAKGKS